MSNQLFQATTRVTKSDNKYTKKVNVPQYKPSAHCPKLYELADKTKYLELVNDIYKSDVPDDIKEFLLLAATRHVVFNYAKIADYYAHADVNTQRLMEESALVIIDIDDAIANGYIRYSETIRSIMKESGVTT